MGIMRLLANKCSAEYFKAYRYSLDHESNSSLDYEAPRNVTKRIAETNPPIGRDTIDLELLSKEYAHYESCFTYFLDGSRRVYKVDDMVFSSNGVKSIYPVVAGQVAVACCRREAKRIYPERIVYECDIALPEKANIDGAHGFFESIAEDLKGNISINKLNIPFSQIFPYRTSRVGEEKYEDKGVAKIQGRMMDLEKEVVADLVRAGKLHDRSYLIKDGSLEYSSRKERKSDNQLMLFKKNYRYVVGVSKRFNPELYLGKNNKPNPGFIANLPLYHRTPVILCQHENIEFGVWYIRIRNIARTRSPFDGVIKVEKMLVTDKEVQDKQLDTETINLLSAQLINERNPVCYGADSRWANHIYPIYLTETYIKQRYINTESFLQLF